MINDIPLGTIDDHPFTYDDGPIRAFAAVPLVGRDGLPLGVLAVHHDAPLALTEKHVTGLQVLADHVMTRLELHRLDSWGGRTLKPSGAIQPTRIRQALEAGELVPFLQPIVDLPTGTTVAFEALIRWEHPEAGVIAPGDFLPAVEASGLMLPVGRHLRQQALDALTRIHRLGPATAEIRLSVNISPIELARPQFAAELLDDVRARGLGPDKLVVEVTETTAFVDPVAAVVQLATLDDAGIQVSLDDYGAGHSSLTRLLSLPLSTIKLDRALTSRLPEDARLGTAVASTISMAKDLGLLVVAEGVETPLQADALRAMGCGYAQGWHFARATSVEDAIATLARTAPAAPVIVPFADVPRPRTSSDPAAQRRSAQACYVVDTERRILSWTAAAEQIAGYRAEEVVGRTCSDGLLWHVDRVGPGALRRSMPAARDDDRRPRAHRQGVAAPQQGAPRAGGRARERAARRQRHGDRRRRDVLRRQHEGCPAGRTARGARPRLTPRAPARLPPPAHPPSCASAAIASSSACCRRSCASP